MSNTEVRAPGEKPDYTNESFYDRVNPNDMGSRVTDQQDEPVSPTNTPPKRRVSTAHIQPGFDIDGTLAYDQFVSTCGEFLGSPTINNTVIQFADNILAILSSPVTLEASEVKRRIEQVLPTDNSYKHYRGTKITEKDCALLCSLADRIVNAIPYQPPTPSHQNNYQETKFHSGDDKRRRSYEKRDTPLPQQLPNFVEPNRELGESVKIDYDLDVTPYDSEVDEPIQIR